MINIAILDDSPEQSASICNVASHYLDSVSLEYRFHEYSLQEDLIQDLSVIPFSIFLLDIELNKLTSTGIDVALNINRMFADAQIIFVTAYEKYYIDSYKADHVYLVPKPRIHELLPEALQKALRKIQQYQTHSLLIRFNKKNYQIPEHSVKYMEKNLRKVTIYAADTFVCYAKLEDILRMATSGVLVQCHKSFAVNIQYIKSLEKSSCVLLDGTVIPVSKRYRSDIFKKLTPLSGGSNA